MVAKPYSCAAFKTAKDSFQCTWINISTFLPLAPRETWHVFEILLFLVFVGKLKLYIRPICSLLFQMQVVLGSLFVRFLSFDHQYINNYINCWEHKFDVTRFVENSFTTYNHFQFQFDVSALKTCICNQAVVCEVKAKY